MKKGNRLYVLQIIEHAKLITEHVEEVDWRDFQADPLLQAAVERWLIIIGEASKKLSSEFLEHHSDIPWRQIRGLRNIVVHEYDSMDISVIYEVVSEHIPSLLSEMEAVRDTEAYLD